MKRAIHPTVQYSLVVQYPPPPNFRGESMLALAVVAAASLLPGHERPQPLQRQHASPRQKSLPTQLPRRSLFGLGTVAAVAASFRSSGIHPAAAAGNPLPLPPAAVVL